MKGVDGMQRSILGNTRQRLKRGIAEFAINMPSKILSEQALTRYYVCLSRPASAVLSREARLVGTTALRIPPEFSALGLSSTPVRVKCTDGTWTVQDAERVSRLLFGIYGMKRAIYDAYRLREIDVPTEGVVIDVGANVGEFSSLFLNTKVRVLSFEPDPYVCSILRINIDAPNIEVHEEALSNQDGTAELAIASATADSSLLHGVGGQASVPVEALRLDRVLDREAIERVQLLKMDAEGFEPEVLEGLGERIRDVERITVDVGPERHGESSSDAVTRILIDAGFHVSHPAEGRRQVLLARNRLLL